MTTLNAYAQQKLAALEHNAQRRRLVPLAREGIHIVHEGERCVSFSSNDYLGLAAHPHVIASARNALETHGAGASRLVTGNHPAYSALEADIAALKGSEAALVMGSGYLTNTGTIPALVGPSDLIVIDELAHACLFAGAQLARCDVERVAHADADAVAAVLQSKRKAYRHVLVVTEGVFSMDGDRAPLAPLSELCREHDAWLYVDDAHATGILGAGRGSAYAERDVVDVPLKVCTFSKALGGYGGAVCADRAVVDMLTSRARTLVYSTALPPSVVAGNAAAVALVRGGDVDCTRPQALAQRFCAALSLPDAQSAIVPLVLGEEKSALDAQAALLRRGFWVTAIRPPTVAAGTSRLRFAFSAPHDEDAVDALAAAVKAVCR